MKKDISSSAAEKEKLREQKKQEKQKEKHAKKEMRRTKRELKAAEKDALAQEKAMMAVSSSNNEETTIKQKFLHSKLYDLLWILNPHNLAREVHVYGYNFSWKGHLLLLACCILGISVIGVLFRLNATYFVFNVIAVIIAIPSGIRYMYRQMYEQKRFTDITTYMEQMLYSFQKSGKILSSLNETKELFVDGNMRVCIDRAMAYIEKGMSKEKGGLLREALSIIEEKYTCVKLTTVHELFINSEEYGGNVENSILLLQEDVNRWKKRGFILQANKKKLNTDNIVSIVVATVICYVALFVLDLMDTLFVTKITFDPFKITIVQFSSFLFILTMLWTFMKSMKKMTTNWLQSEDVISEKLILSSYETIVEYDEVKQRSKSILYAAPFVIIALVGFMYQKQWLVIASIIVVIFMLQQHKVGYKLAMKDVNRALYISLPQWFMQLALLLQQNNVQVSLAKSIEDAPVILKPELEKLMIRLAENPDKLTSYTDFCKDFDVPEATSCMKMLHAIAESGVGNAQIQIAHMTERVNEMQDIADDLRNQDIAFNMKLIFSYPILAATVKLLIDMTISMGYLMQLLSSMGGA